MSSKSKKRLDDIEKITDYASQHLSWQGYYIILFID